ncbi:MAG: quercetin 2,3-dioxygenase [Verrucomicrobia bacterium Tous-C9LFEB]|nr:MAG: quercetin 2,3-dioxygenase [Verrucomicrobia bacterium Tous-C9LFEB]
MIEIRKSDERGHAKHGWLDSRHTFSFADYYDPKHTGFHSLRVINEDRVAPEMGFSTHPHRDMEIITYVISGALRHRDSMGNTAVMRCGDVQRISAGTGIEHSEVNDSTSEPVHFLQIWIIPDHKNAKPAYAEKSFADVKSGVLHLITSKSGRAGSIPINQDADLYFARLEKGQTVAQAIRAKHHTWVQVIRGELDVNGNRVQAGDALATSGEESLSIKALDAAEFLLFDLNS